MIQLKSSNNLALLLKVVKLIKVISDENYNKVRINRGISHVLLKFGLECAAWEVLATQERLQFNGTVSFCL